MGSLHADTAAARLDDLGDFTVTTRVLTIAAMAIGIGALAAYIALVLLKLIGFFTNLFFFQRIGTALVSPEGHHLGLFVIVVPIIGALIVGVMARYGSDKIRGHGIPEAIEAILMNGSRVDPKVALLKPLSAAISIGSGGPFGAEGPIIMTGGAVGSLIAQFFHSDQHRAQDAARRRRRGRHVGHLRRAGRLGHAGHRAAAVRVEAAQHHPRGARQRHGRRDAPLHPRHGPGVSGAGAFRRHRCGGDLSAASSSASSAGVMSALLTQAVYASEDAFAHLPIHWMWWPAIGGLVIGIGGFVFPQALGVGYDVIAELLQGDTPRRVILGVLLVKSTIWAVSLGSGTSGGVLAPLLMIGGALGGFEARLPAARGRRLLAAREHGRRARRHDARAAHRHHLRAWS